MTAADKVRIFSQNPEKSLEEFLNELLEERQVQAREQELEGLLDELLNELPEQPEVELTEHPEVELQDYISEEDVNRRQELSFFWDGILIIFGITWFFRDFLWSLIE